MAGSVYSRAMLKLSGRSIIGKSEYGIDAESASYVATQIKVAHDMGVQMGAVIGGGTSGEEPKPPPRAWTALPPTTPVCSPPS